MENLSSVAQQLFTAYETREPIAPPRETIEGLDLEGAYEIQRLQEEMFLARGEEIVGRKIGLTSKAMQEQLGVDSPDFGFFTNKMTYADGDSIDVSRFIAPKVEPELAFRLGADVEPGSSVEDLVIDAVILAVEIIDSRVRDWDIRLVDTVADNASCGAVILGREIEVAPEDLPAVTASMLIDAQVASEGAGSAVLGHPLNPIPWLAGIVGLKKGDIILTGSFSAAAPVVAGQAVDVDYGEYGHLKITFK